jgi:hypothetical protein
VIHCVNLLHELRKVMGANKIMILVPLFDLKSLRRTCGTRYRDFRLAVLGMMVLRCAVLLAAAVTLSNCCLLSSGCSAITTAATPPAPPTSAPPARTVPAAPAASPVATSATSAWDGLGSSAGEDSESEVEAVAPKKRASRRVDNTDTSAQSSYSYRRGSSSWEEEQAADRADDARLKQKLIICRTCSAQ